VERFDHLVEGRVGESVPIRAEERLVVADIGPRRAETIADRRVDAGVEERDAPVLHVAADELPLAPCEQEVVGVRILVLEEPLLHDLRPIAEAQDEVLVSPRGVPVHDVPENRLAPDRNHWLRDALGRFAHAHSMPPQKMTTFTLPSPLATHPRGSYEHTFAAPAQPVNSTAQARHYRIVA
jgi:hypothetical protein